MQEKCIFFYFFPYLFARVKKKVYLCTIFTIMNKTMKNNNDMKKSILILTTMAALVFFGCKESPYISSPGDGEITKNDTMPSIADPDPTPDPAGVAIPEGTINVNEAVKIGMNLPASDKDNKYPTEKEYYIKGWVSRFNDEERSKSDFESKFAQYGNDYVYLKARNDGKGTKEFYCYRILGKNGAPLPDHDALQIGDFVVIKCQILKFGSSTVENHGTCAIYSSSNVHFNEVFPPFPGCPEPGEGEISVNRAKEISDSIGAGKTTSESYKIRGVVVSVNDKTLSNYGNMTFNISSDGDVTATCYRLFYKSANNKFTNLNQVMTGDTVLVNAKIQNYNGTCEPVQGFIEQSTNPNF